MLQRGEAILPLPRIPFKTLVNVIRLPNRTRLLDIQTMTTMKTAFHSQQRRCLPNVRQPMQTVFLGAVTSWTDATKPSPIR